MNPDTTPVEPDQGQPTGRRHRILPWALAAAAVVVGAAIWATTTGAGSDPNGESDRVEQGPIEAAPVPEGPIGAVDPFFAHPFEADLFDGTTFRLTEHLASDGRPVFLNLWASWCFPCREEMPAIDAVAARHPEVFFLGVAVEDDPAAAEDFAAEIGVDYTLGIDETGLVAQMYPALGLPATFLITPDQQVVGRLFGGASEQTFEEFLTNLNR